MANRKAITRAQAVRYRNGTKAAKSAVLDSVCEITGYNRDYARRVLRAALTPKVVAPRTPREPTYGTEVVGGLEKCWAVLNAAAGKRLAPALAELVPALRGHGELDIDDDTAAASGGPFDEWVSQKDTGEILAQHLTRQRADSKN